MLGKLDSGHTYQDFELFHKYGIIDGPLYPVEGNYDYVASFECVDLRNDEVVKEFCDLFVIHLKDSTYFAIVLDNDESLVADLWDLPKMAINCRLHAQALEILKSQGIIRWSKS